MTAGEKTVDEAARLEELRAYAVLDSAPERDFDELVALVAQVCDAPMALINLVDAERQWFKATVGLTLCETRRDKGVCPQVMFEGKVVQIPDLAQDERFAILPTVKEAPHLRFYAGAPLVTATGQVLGMLCVFDLRPRELSAGQLEMLRVLGAQVMAQLELRRCVQTQARTESALLGILEDQRIAQDALRASEAEQRTLAERLEEERAQLEEAQAVANLGSWETDLVTMNLEWSEQTHRIFETDPTKFRPTYDKFLACVHPEDRAALNAALLRSIKEHAAQLIEHRAIMPDGRIKHVEERWQVRHDASGRAVRAVGTCQDITERRSTESQLHLLSNSIARLNDIVLITEAETIDEPGPRVVFVNDAFERVTGYARSDIIGRSPRLLQGPHTDRATLERIRSAITKGLPVHEELLNYGKDGREYWIDVNIAPVSDAVGKVTHLVAIQRDITERKALEARFLRAQRMESIGTLAGGIAHDLNNLLAPILMGVELLQRETTTDVGRQVLQSMERSALRGASLVKQVLSFARGVEGARVSVHLKHIVAEIENIVVNTFPKNILFEREMARDLQLVMGDPTQLNQVLLNLCVNARDAMPVGGRLGVKAYNAEIDAHYAMMNRGVVAGRFVVVEVTDTGEGMSKEVAERVFEPFFTTKAVGSGTGLGLSTVLGIVRSHGGVVNVYSEPAKGSVFKVYLPAQPLDTAYDSTAASVEPAPRGRGELILVVDDESSIRSIVAQTLESFGYRVVVAEDGAQGVAIFAARRAEVKLILTDMMMPVMDGVALIAAVRRIDQQVGIIAASGLDANGNVAKAAAVGVREFLPKPYSAELLLRTLRRVLDGETTTGE